MAAVAAISIPDAVKRALNSPAPPTFDRSGRRARRTITNQIMILIGQITANASSPAVQVAMLVAVGLGLFVAVKIGGVILKMILGLLGLALLGGAFWWFIAK